MGEVRGIWGMGLRRLFVVKTATSAKPVSELGLFHCLPGVGIWEFILGSMLDTIFVYFFLYLIDLDGLFTAQVLS
jgi:hypothetical protein